MSPVTFLWRYVRRYAGWATLAGLGIVTYAAATGGIVSLIEPIFGEVLLARDGAPSVLGMATPSASVEKGAEKKASNAPDWFIHLKRRLDFEHKIQKSYESLKRQWGIGDRQVVWFVPLLFVLVFLVRSLSDFLSGYSFQHMGLGVTTDIRNDLYRRILDQSSRFHADHPSGELVARVVNDVALMQSAVANRLLDLFQQSLTLVVLLGLLLSTHVKLALICLVVAPVLIYPIIRFGRGMRRTSHRSQERMADLASLMNEGIRGHRVVKAFGMEAFERGRFEAATRRHLRTNLRAQLLANASGPVVESLAVIGAAALLFWAGRSIRAGDLTAPELIKFLTTALMMYDPIRKLNKVNMVLQEALAAGQRASRLLAIPDDIAERPDARSISGVRQGIRFERVSFAYEARTVLSDVELDIRRGEIVALVGPSGAGKSTLVNLLPRFFDVDSGKVTIDGVDIRDLKLQSLRALIGVVTQDTVLFNDTVRNNIAYGRSDLSLDRVREAAAAAYADEFIHELPNGYDSVIGESGLRLSGGQRQRLAIARALLKDAPILILDEATSHLDTESEALVQKALYNLMQGRTTLVIAHRLSTVMKADRIVVVEGGRIVEEGSHAELLERGGSYKRLYDLQFQE
ncbi:MAG TPA: ABC transporter ATP-binding protein [Thermoanaerobaculia bacterium]|nr:ABC transporter ATP-binding protein [Thermoanaerobaculia bacterium]